MQVNPAEEWQNLTEHYHTLFDGELEQLAADFGDLTPTAQQVLRNDMKNRGLGDPGAPAKPGAPPKAPPKPDTPEHERWVSAVDPDALSDKSEGSDGAGSEGFGEDVEDDGPHEFTWKTLLCECGSYGEAWEIHKALALAGVESWVEQPGRDRVSCIRVVVAADQLEQAREIAARPIPKEIIEEYNAEVPEFVAPKCPKCGTEDPVLESADPTNSWLCEACGEQWTEPVAETR
jgi:hypothetical protein